MLHRALLVLSAVSLVPLPGAAQPAEAELSTFMWADRVGSGQWVRVRNGRGSVEVIPVVGDIVTVDGARYSRRGLPDSVYFVVVPDSDGVTICALWSRSGRCDARAPELGQLRGDVQVDLVVGLPRGVRIDVALTHGRVTVEGASSEVVVNTVSGEVDLRGLYGSGVRARSVSGNVWAQFNRVVGGGALRFASVSGSVYVAMPLALDADVEMSTLNGTLYSDYPMRQRGVLRNLDNRRLRAKVGAGGRHVEMISVTGNVELRKH